jgi:hypothetical protein
MRKLRRKLTAQMAVGAAVVVTICSAIQPSVAQTLPSDAQPTCTVPAATFATWFQSGTPTVNGVVNPANSVAFSNVPNCPFYQWSKQMFLWLTSPSPSIYGGKGLIIDSPVFYDVSPPDSSGARTLLPHTPGFIRPFSVRAAQVGPLGLPVVFDTSGRMLEIQRAEGVVTSLRIPDTTGNRVEITHAERSADGALVLRDASGSIVRPRSSVTPRNVLALPSTGSLLVREFVIDKIPIFIDPFGNVVEVEQGQADGSVLESQGNSLIYYAIMVNDVYAYFLTGQKDGKIDPGVSKPQFPTTMTDLNAITSFAASHSASFVDPTALAVEIKSSWVEASSLPSTNNYITIEAQIPTYNTSNKDLWTPTGTKTTTLALVGMHVVGSTAGHPEMIWATFEHFGNTPNAAYTYINSHGSLASVPQSTAGSWLFSASNSSGPFNQTHMTQSGANIQAAGSFTISPSDTIRWKPFGAASDANFAPNPIDGSAAASNSEIISINTNVSAMMPTGDVRNNYYMTGATWTIGGAAPQPVFESPIPGDLGNQVGTSQLSNSTMETYQQGKDTTAANGGSNCFSCHSSISSPIDITQLSHVYEAIKPLF